MKKFVWNALGTMLISLVAVVAFIALEFAFAGCGPVTVQIRQEQWKCEARQESSDGTIDFRGCRRDGTDVQESDQPDSGPEVTVPVNELSLLN